MKQKTEVMKKEGNLIKRINILDVVQIVGVQKALNTYAHWYGAPALDFSDRTVAEFETRRARCVRHVFGLRYAAHTTTTFPIQYGYKQCHGSPIQLVSEKCVIRWTSLTMWGVRYLTCCNMSFLRSIIVIKHQDYWKVVPAEQVMQNELAC